MYRNTSVQAGGAAHAGRGREGRTGQDRLPGCGVLRAGEGAGEGGHAGGSALPRERHGHAPVRVGPAQQRELSHADTARESELSRLPAPRAWGVREVP